jgi:hypothetical protein
VTILLKPNLASSARAAFSASADSNSAELYSGSDACSGVSSRDGSGCGREGVSTRARRLLELARVVLALFRCERPAREHPADGGVPDRRLKPQDRTRER